MVMWNWLIIRLISPDPTVIDHVEEPYVNATIIVPKDYVGAVMELSQEKTR